MTPKIDRFRELHAAGTFVLPNPWDVGSARFLAAAGFRALATTSAGLAFTLGRPDSPTSLHRDEVLENVRAIVGATDLPVNTDFQAGYGSTPEAVAESVARCIETGVAGLSIEDASGEDGAPLYDLTQAVERVHAAREAIDASGRGVVLTGRAECFLVDSANFDGRADALAESVKRLVAYAEAGADCLYAPGLKTDDEIREVVGCVAPKPVNVLTADPKTMTVARLRGLGVRRISVGSAMVRVAWRAFMLAAREIADDGAFSSLADAEPFATFDALFA